MANPLYNQLETTPKNDNGISNIINETKRLQQTVKNPRQEVERLINSGEMSQAQFNQFAQYANYIMKFM